MANVGSATVEINHTGSGDTIGALQSVGSAISTLGGIALGVAAAGVAAFGAGLKLAIDEAMEGQRVTAQTEAVIKSTGGAAGVSASQVGDLASALQNMTGISDETIASGENMLLTFTKIGSEIFPAATNTILDMSVALGTDLKSSAIQLGKALNDPINGITALQRVGVTFSDTQKIMINNMIKQGNLLGAQKVILEELNKEFGGSAAAAGKTFAGQMEIAKLKLLDIAEAAGARLLPALSTLTTIGLPLVEKFALAGADALNSFMLGLDAVMPTVTRLVTVIGGAFANLRAGMPVMDLLGRLFPGVFSPEIRGAIESIGAALGRIGEALNPAVAGFVTAFGDALKASFGENSSLIIDNITNAFNGLATFFTNNGPAIAAAATFIGQTLGAALGGIVTIISGLAGALGQLAAGDFSGALTTLGNTLTGFANGVSQAFGGVDFSVVIATWASNLNMLGLIISGTAANAIAAAQAWADGVLSGLTAPLVNLAGQVTGYITGAITALQGMVGGMSAVGAALGNGLVSGAAGVVGKIVAVVVGAVEAAIAAAKAAAGVSSPSRVMAEVGGNMSEGLAVGITSGARSAIDAMRSMTNATMQPAMAAPAAMPATANAGGASMGGAVTSVVQNFYGINDPEQIASELERILPHRGLQFSRVS